MKVFNLKFPFVIVIRGGKCVLCGCSEAILDASNYIAAPRDACLCEEEEKEEEDPGVLNQVWGSSRHNSKLNQGQACSRYEQRAVLPPAGAWLGRHATLSIPTDSRPGIKMISSCGKELAS